MRVLGSLLVSALLVGGACDDGDVAAPGGPGTDTGGLPDTGALPQQFSVTIRDFAFDPAELTVPLGSTVTWTNLAAGAQSITSGAAPGDPRNGEEFDQRVPSGGRFQFIFDEPGTFPYFSRVEGPLDLAGVIIVTGGEPAAVEPIAPLVPDHGGGDGADVIEVPGTMDREPRIPRQADPVGLDPTPVMEAEPAELPGDTVGSPANLGP